MGAMQDLTVIESLSIVVIRGFDWNREDDRATRVDPPGSANYFCALYSMSGDDPPKPPGILWTDYESIGGDWDFAVLIATSELDALRGAVAEFGYEVVEVDTVTDPTCFGDGNNGTVEILQHRDGWVVMNSGDFC